MEIDFDPTLNVVVGGVNVQGFSGGRAPLHRRILQHSFIVEYGEQKVKSVEGIWRD
jgi:hypothetical protein